MKPSFISVLVVSCMTASAIAQSNDQLQYDPRRAAKNQQRAVIEEQTHECMHESIKAGLQQGERDRTTIAIITLRICAQMITQTMRADGVSEQRISAKLKTIFDAELNDVLAEAQ
jgi:hypothetical protein